MLINDDLIQPSSFFNQFILRSWWVILFFLLCFFIFDQASSHQVKQKSLLTQKLITIQQEKEFALASQADLTLQIASQNDPEYIEMVLMRKLGLTLEGQTKVLFID